MLDRTTHHIEVADTIAVIYVVGAMCTEAVRSLAADCELLPEGVRNLRLYVGDFGLLDQCGTAFLRDLRRDWRDRRRGWFRVAISWRSQIRHL
jgi:hypothetical protein